MSVPRALGLSRLSEEQHASKEPFHLSTPPQQAELPTHGQELPALPPCKHPPGSSTHYPAPRTPTKLLDKCYPALLVLNLSHGCSPLPPSPAAHGAVQPHRTAAAGAGVLPCRRRRLLLLNCFHPSASPGRWDAGGCFAQPLFFLCSTFRVQEMCSFHFRSCRKAVFCLLGSSQGLKPLWRKGR